LSGTAPATSGGTDGRIGGTTAAMEFRAAESGIWTNCAAGFTAAAPGNYEVRLRAAASAFSGEAAAVTVPANDAQPTCTLTLNANGGIVTPTSATGATGTTYTLPTPTRGGHTFTGWALSGGGSLSGNTYTFGTGDGTVTAQWTQNTTPPTPKKYIFSTRYEATFLNWILFFLLFGWLWMWF
jgi:uncharacterized repeat protein (TIGR02543 family)